MRISAKADYAVRAMVELAATGDTDQRPVDGELIAAAQRIPLPFLESIMSELRVHELVHSRSGADGGYWLARDPAKISLADVIEAVEGPLASVHGEAPHDLDLPGAAARLQPVWAALEATVRGVLEPVSLADVVAGRLPNAAPGSAADEGRAAPNVP